MEKNKKSSTHQIAYDTLHLALTLVELDKKTRFYGTDVPIFYSEIHVIMAIAEHPGIHAGGLSEILGVTRGSVSEILKKLEKKSLIRKETDAHNLSKYSLSLTEKGGRAHANHLLYHSILNGVVDEELKHATPDELEFLSGFLHSLINKVKRFSENLEESNRCP